MNPSSRHKVIGRQTSPGDSGDSQGEGSHEDTRENRQKPQSRLLKKPPLTVPMVLSTVGGLKRSQESDHNHGQPRRGLQSEEYLAIPNNEHGQPAKEKHAPCPREPLPDEGPAALTRMIGYLARYALDDWGLVLEVCERASTSEGNAKEAVRALRREFKYGKLVAQLSAARLWAIMLCNSSDVFIIQCTSRKFLGIIENLLRSGQTSPVVRDRLIDIVAAAAYASSSKETGSDRGFKGLWQRVKPSNKPDEGVPFDMDDAMFLPPSSSHRSRYEVWDEVARPFALTNNSDSSTNTTTSAHTPPTPDSQMQYQPHNPSLDKAESLLSLMTSPLSSRSPLPSPPGTTTSMPYLLVPSTGSVPGLNYMLHKGYHEPYISAAPMLQYLQDPLNQRKEQDSFPPSPPSDAGTWSPPPFGLNTPATPPPRYSQLLNID